MYLTVSETWCVLTGTDVAVGTVAGAAGVAEQRVVGVGGGADGAGVAVGGTGGAGTVTDLAVLGGTLVVRADDGGGGGVPLTGIAVAGAGCEKKGVLLLEVS